MTDDDNDNADLERAYARLARSERRARLRNAIATIKAAQRAGLAVRSAEIEGVTLGLAGPERTAPARATDVIPAADFNEWDRDLGASSPPSLRQ